MDHKQGLPIVVFASAQECQSWFERNHDQPAGFWLKIGKKANPAPSVTYAEALDVALCFGWIDGQKASFDDQWWLQRFTHRTAKSPWSKVNVNHVARLVEAGRMRAAGQAVIDAAKADGRWERAYHPQSNAPLPADFAAALDAHPAAATFFASLKATDRYSMLYRIHEAKRADTRARRIAQYVELLGNRETLSQWQAKKTAENRAKKEGTT
jgi:uncharacterized protein YdeI (YjbR/CyaY-like superfamily)